MITCNVCKQRVLSHARSLNCCICAYVYHINCLPLEFDITSPDWICMHCANDVFPFNHITDNDTYLTTVNDFFFNDNLSRLVELIFNPFEINDINEVLPLLDVDPDLQFFNNIAGLQNYPDNCNYYVEDSFNKKIRNLQSNCLSLLHLNIRSLPRHYNEFKCYLDNLDINFSVIGLTETWLKSSNSDLYNLDGYNHVSQCRECRTGGGVSLLLNENWSYTVRDDLRLNDNFVECLFIELSKSVVNLTKDVVVGVIYRPPNTDIYEFNKKFLELLSIVHRENKLVYLLGDYNVNLLNAENHIPSAEFLEIFYSNGFLPLITKPTRIQNSFTLIDNIFSNQIYDNEIMSGILHTDISDHLPIFMLCYDKIVDYSNNSYKSRDFSYKNTIKFQNMLTDFDWEQVLNCNDCQQAFTVFHKNYKTIFDRCFPLKVRETNYFTRKKWLSFGLKNSIKIKNKLYVKYRKNPTADNHEKYKRYRNHLSSLMKSAEKQYYEDSFRKNKSNLRKSWGIIKSIIGKKSSKVNLQFMVNNQLTSNAQSIANNFNNFFVNIGPNLKKHIPDSEIDPLQYLSDIDCMHSIYLRGTNNEELTKIIKDLKDSGSGYDEVTAKAVKDTFHIYLTPLVHLINLSLAQGIFPKELKIARVVPLYKSGDSRLIKNYRPVSVLPVFSKIFERIIHSRLLEFF